MTDSVNNLLVDVMFFYFLKGIEDLSAKQPIPVCGLESAMCGGLSNYLIMLFMLYYIQTCIFVNPRLSSDEGFDLLSFF
ncbi:MAG: hypothetical protein JSV98_10330, partial [candidate division WOR-3 bacterium]